MPVWFVRFFALCLKLVFLLAGSVLLLGLVLLGAVALLVGAMYSRMRQASTPFSTPFRAGRWPGTPPQGQAVPPDPDSVVDVHAREVAQPESARALRDER